MYRDALKTVESQGSWDVDGAATLTRVLETACRGVGWGEYI